MDDVEGLKQTSTEGCPWVEDCVLRWVPSRRRFAVSEKETVEIVVSEAGVLHPCGVVEGS